MVDNNLRLDKEKQKAVRYYNWFSRVYDLISSKSYYHKIREFAISELNLVENQTVLNIPCGTGQNFEYYQKYLNNSGELVAIDISEGMLSKANAYIEKNHWKNIKTFAADASEVNTDWVNTNLAKNLKFDSILCDLGLSGFPDWQSIIDNLISLLRPNGSLVVMDWYIKKPTLRGEFIKWIGKGEVNRPIYQYIEGKLSDFKLNNSFKSGDMFVASGIKK